MYVVKLVLMLFWMICQGAYCKRRIEGGVNVSENKTYVVYLVRASMSSRNYDYWLCGGAIITRYFIITSAACVEDVEYLYAIAGYRKYVNQDNIDKNECTKKMKKKVVFTCVPQSYNFDFDILEKWAYIDIALVRVESPYDFTDDTYEAICSYKPSVIPINYDPKYQLADTDSMVIGWGHNTLWRKHGDFENYNSEDMQYAPTLIMDKRRCMQAYTDYPNMTYIIEQYMICTYDAGSIDDAGHPMKEHPSFDGCITEQQLKDPISRNEYENSRKPIQAIEICEDNYGHDNNPATGYDYYDDSQHMIHLNPRRNIANQTDEWANRTFYNYTTYDYIKKAVRDKMEGATRRNGICQNDHGGPLVTWVGKREVLIGIASVFRIDEDNECGGPYLYTSTQCNGAFIDCVLNSYDELGIKRLSGLAGVCDSPPSQKGFETIENHISWKDHPAGPAYNEIYPLNKNVAATQYLQYGPNGQYAGNPLRNTANQQPAVYAQSGLYAQNAINLKSAPNAKSTVNLQSTSNVQNAVNQPSTSNQQSASDQHSPNPNIRGFPDDYVQPKERYQGKQLISSVDTNNEGLLMRPQRPLRTV